MPIKVECDVCGAKYRVGSERSGTVIPCKSCGADMEVPEAGHGADEFFEDEGPRRPRPRGARVQRSNGALIAGLAGAGLLVLGLIIGLVFLLRGGDDEPEQVAQNNAGQAGGGHNPIASNGNTNPNPRPNPWPNRGGGNNPQPTPVEPDPQPNQVQPNPPPNPRGQGFQPADLPPDVAKNVPPQARDVLPRGADEIPQPGRGFQALENAPVAVNPDHWAVEVDPPAQPYAAGDKVSIPVSTKAGREFKVFPGTSFVSVGENRNERDLREIWDVSQRRKLGTLTGAQLPGDKIAISRDGRYYAATGTFFEGVLVFDLKEGQPLGKLPLDKGADVLGIAGSDYVVAGGGWGAPLMVWELPSGDLTREIEPPKDWSKESVCFSPGGKHMALMTTHWTEGTLVVYDLATGEIVGESPLPPLENGSASVKGMAFSHDGTEIAALLETHGKHRIGVWKVSDGQLIEDFQYETKGHHPWRNHAAIQWFPGKQRWFIQGYAIVDRQGKQIIWEFPTQPGSDVIPLVLDDSRLVALGGTNNKPMLTEVQLQEDLLAKASETVQSGGLAIDSVLPKLTAAQWDGVQTVSLEVAAGWQVTPDPAPPAAGALLERPVDVSASKGGSLQGLQISNAEAAKAAVFYTTVPDDKRRPDQKETQTGKKIAWVELVDLTTGQSGASIDLDFATVLTSLSPSGQRALFRLAPTNDRLDVYNAADGTHYVAWRPFLKEENERNRQIEAAMFVDDDHVLTLNPARKLVLWKLPECRAVYEIENVDKSGVSPGGRYLVVSNGRSLQFFDSRTGESRGSLNLDNAIDAPAFHPDGNRLAIISRRGGDTYLMVWSLQDGQVQVEFPIPVSGGTMHWCGDNHLLLDNKTLIDLPRTMVVWTYEVPNGIHSPVTPDGRHWYLASRATGTSGVYLAAATLPEPKVEEKLAAANPTPKLELEPGGRVSLQLNLSSPAGKPNLVRDVQQRLLAHFEASQITVAEGAPIVLTLSMAQSGTGENHEYRLFGGGEISYAGSKVECRAQYARQGQTVWQTQTVATNSLGFIAHIDQNRPVEEQASEAMWNGAARFFENLTPPTYVFSEGSAEGLGTSNLTPDGPQIARSGI